MSLKLAHQKKEFLYCLHKYGGVGANLLFGVELQKEMSDWLLFNMSQENQFGRLSISEEKKFEISLQRRLIECLQAVQESFSGFGEKEWSFVGQLMDQQLGSNQVPLVLKEWIVKRALESNQWELVLKFKELKSLATFQAQLYLKRDCESLRQVMNAKTDPKILAAEILNLRITGDQEQAVELIERSYILQNISQLSSWDRGQILLICGSPYFNLAHYSKALALYRQAFEIFDLEEETASSAIAAFNLAATHHVLDQEKDVQFWLKMVNQKLKTFQLPCLSKSLSLFEAQREIVQNQPLRALAKTEEVFTFQNLSEVQKVLARQAQGQAHLELGQVFQAQISLGMSRRHIAEKGFTQFSQAQTALEIFEAGFGLQGMEYAGKENVQDPRADAQSSLYLLAWKLRRVAFQARSMGQLKTDVSDLVARVPIVLQKRIGLSEWMDFVSSPHVPADKLSILEVQMISAVAQKNWSVVHAILQKMESFPSSPWSECLKSLGRGFYAFSMGDREKMMRCFNEALMVAQAQGLMLLACLARGGLVYQDSHHEVEWLHTMNKCSPSVKEDLSAFFTLCFGEDLTSTHWILKRSKLSKNEQEYSEGLLVDEMDGVVLLKGTKLDIKSQSILFLILKHLVESGLSGLSKEQLIQLIWGREYSPFQDDPIIYSHIRRLRKSVMIELHIGKYRVSPLQKAKIRNAWTDTEPLTKRQRDILSLVSGPQRILRRQDVVRNLGLSPRTAVRELTLLVEMRLLSPIGAGRSAGYVVNKGA
ncbi:MAG: winged helix-turn-helix domain-containing protein [Bdellovibrionales bacterium]